MENLPEEYNDLFPNYDNLLEDAWEELFPGMTGKCFASREDRILEITNSDLINLRMQSNNKIRQSFLEISQTPDLDSLSKSRYLNDLINLNQANYSQQIKELKEFYK
jgi:hypothetical protein